MKAFKRVLIVLLVLSFAVSFVACGFLGNDENKPIKPDKPNGGDQQTTGVNLTPDDIKTLNDLINYGSKQLYWNKAAVSFDAEGKTYTSKDCTAQLEKLQARIDQKHADVVSGDSTSSFVKIFAMSTAEGLLEKMALAALTFEEMNKVVDYLAGSVDANIADYLVQEANGSWSGFFSDGSTEWRDKKNASGKAFNDGWSFFDDWEMYDRLEDFAEDDEYCDDKDLAGDNAAWHYRSILGKIYTQVELDGDAAARLATYMLDYGVTIVEEKSGGLAEDAIVVSNGVTNFGAFTNYCKKIPLESDPFSGLADYETLSYLLAFNDYYADGDGTDECVTLYGYYYDYNETYYFESLADEETYAKQLKYEKMSIFTDAEWLDYVSIQRNNYAKAYRYDAKFYQDFYSVHFEFQGIIEGYDEDVYQLNDVASGLGITRPKATYTGEMKNAVQASSDGLNGLNGQLAMSDWIWCYAGSEDNMKSYNAANTKNENGKNDGSSEKEYEGRFYYEYEQLKIVYYLFENMTSIELSSALYYQVYAYSASMVNTMQNDIKNIVYIQDAIENGAYYTHISASVLEKNDQAEEDIYAIGKISVLYKQAYDSWFSPSTSELAGKAKGQNWSDMKTELKAALDYNYMDMEIVKQSEAWKERVEMLEDMVIAREYSCCGQRVSEADVSKCSTGHVENPDGTLATKEYATDHTISQFVSAYEKVLYHIAGQATYSFQKGASKSSGFSGYATSVNENRSWTAGYYGDISELNRTAATKLAWVEDEVFTLNTGDPFIDTIDGESEDFWTTRKELDADKNAYGPFTHAETYSGADLQFKYTYEFVGWFLDKDCKYEFCEDDEIETNLIIYSGYNVTKTKVQ